MNKWQILVAAVTTGWSIAHKVYKGLSGIHDWEHFRAFKIEHIVGVEENV